MDDLYAHRYRCRGVAPRGLPGLSFILMQPELAAARGYLSFWMMFTAHPSAGALRAYLEGRPPFDYIHLWLFPMESCRSISSPSPVGERSCGGPDGPGVGRGGCAAISGGLRGLDALSGGGPGAAGAHQPPPCPAWRGGVEGLYGTKRGPRDGRWIRGLRGACPGHAARTPLWRRRFSITYSHIVIY